MPFRLIKLAEAAQISGKSIQTLRRMIKDNKIKFRRVKTPQGFTYMIEEKFLLESIKKGKEAIEPLSKMKIRLQGMMGEKPRLRPLGKIRMIKKKKIEFVPQGEIKTKKKRQGLIRNQF